jgi:hypothetical protein
MPNNYTIEGNINFQEELYKLLDQDSEDEDTLCQITGLPLKDNSITLECKHHFNYDALYKEIYNQKYEFKTYDLHTLPKKDLEKYRNSNLDYFIKCPYCRSIQFTILPYYEELGLQKVYGINSLDTKLKTAPPSANRTGYNYQKKPYHGDKDYTFNKFGTTFKWGQCCQKISPFVLCSKQYVANIPNTDLSYCRFHYRYGISKYKIEKKQEEIAKKMALKKEKQDKLDERKKLFEEKNSERASKGLPPLKRLPVIKKKVENVVEQLNNLIQQYVPELEQVGCNAILKTGPNKGNKCGCKKIDANGLCKRHSPKNETNNELKVDKNVK